jgi:hypothetical protein
MIAAARRIITQDTKTVLLPTHPFALPTQVAIVLRGLDFYVRFVDDFRNTELTIREADTNLSSKWAACYPNERHVKRQQNTPWC